MSFTITINGNAVQAEPKQTLLEICRNNKVPVPVMCHFDGLADVGACRLCLVEVEGSPRLFPACTTPVVPDMKIKTESPRLQHHRRMIVELFFSERNHYCAVCVANRNCELQDLAASVGMDHVRFPWLNPECRVDASHKEFVLDHNRCVMCTRCVRVCDEVEGAHNWDVAGRGYQARIIADFNQPWGESTTCTSCGKCIQVCPTGALWPKNAAQGRLERAPSIVTELALKRRSGS